MTFDADSTTDDVLDGVDLTGQTALVTGASAGLGVETARALASVGAHLVLGVRDTAKGEAAAETIRASVPGAGLELGTLDLASLASVRTFADEIRRRHDRLDLLINNAGVMAPPLRRTADGFELQLGTNHLGHFLLTGLLAPALLAAAPARIVNLSSQGHVRSTVDFDDPHYRTRPYEKWAAYGQSKTANIWFSLELERRLGARGVHAYAVHPGVIATELSRHLTRDDLSGMRSRIKSAAHRRKPVQAGAATSVWAATSRDLADTGGVYLADCRVVDEVQEPGQATGRAPWALDPEGARRLWDWSEDQVGQQFPLD